MSHQVVRVVPSHLVTISPFSMHSVAASLGSIGAPASSALGVANKAWFIPFRLSVPVLAQKLSWANGTTVNGNTDMGIYTYDGVRLVSTGSTVQTGASAIQTVDIADTPLGPGLYYLALATSSSTATYRRSTLATLSLARVLGIFMQLSAFALPATATFATADAAPYIANHFISARTVV